MAIRYTLNDRALAEKAGLLSFPRLQNGQTLNNPSVAFELFAQHPGTALMPIGAYGYSHSVFHARQLGRYCSIAKNVRTMGAAHPHHWASTSPRFYSARGRAKFQIPEPREPLIFRNRPHPVEIGHDVWIGQDVLLRDGIRIGTGAVVAAGSVVTADVAPYTIVGGAPARLIRPRFDEVLAARLLMSEWWMYETANVINLPADDPQRFVAKVEEEKADWTQRPLAYKTLEKHMLESPLATAILRVE